MDEGLFKTSYLPSQRWFNSNEPLVDAVKRVVRQALFEEYFSPFATLLRDDSVHGDIISPHEDLAKFLKEVIHEFNWINVDDLDSLKKCSIRRSHNGPKGFGNYNALATALKEKVNQLPEEKIT
jgi:hypothetical protein